MTGRGAGADCKDTETEEPEGNPATVTEAVTDAVGVARVRGTVGNDVLTATPLVAANPKGPTTHVIPSGTSPRATISRRRACVVPDGRTVTRGVWWIRIAPYVEESATLAWETDPSKSSAAIMIIDAVGEKEAKSSVETRNSRVAPEAAAGSPATDARRLQFSSAFAGNSKRRADSTRPEPPRTSATYSAPRAWTWYPVAGEPSVSKNA